jgi:hypothetical protein
MRLTRRMTLLGGLALGAAPAAFAEDTYRGWTIDMSLVPEARRAASLASVKAQVDLVESIDFDPEIKAWFRTTVIHVDPSLNSGRVTERNNLQLKADPVPADQPVLLHELMHVFHFMRHPRSPVIIAFYEAAKASNQFPPQAYMLSNPREFFAMCASVVLWGRADRPPGTRENVRRKLPELYDWIVAQFSLQV